MSTYVLRHDGRNWYTLSKWENGEVPAAVYELKVDDRSAYCNCPASFRYGKCKHIQLVRAMLQNKITQIEIP